MVRDLVTTEAGSPTSKPEFVLLRPEHTPPRTGSFFQRLAAWYDVPFILRSAARSEFLAVDFETRGNDYSLTPAVSPDALQIVGLALAWSHGSAYIHWSDLSWTLQNQVTELLLSHPRLLAHNVYFDGGVILTKAGAHPNWHACTLALYRLLANEGWPGQQHGLKKAMSDILLWENTNEAGIDEWLITNGYYKGNRRKNNDPAYLVEEYRQGKLSPEKSQMWRVPKAILGKYAILDAEACYLLYTKHLLPCSQEFPGLVSFFHDEFMPHILLHIEQKILGIPVDRDALFSRREDLVQQIDQAEQVIRTHPDLVPHIQAIEESFLEELRQTEPEQFRKKKPAPKEPQQYTRNGSLSKSWTKWQERMAEWELTSPEVSKNWENWRDRLDRAESGNDPDYRFNLNSDKQMIELLYTRLGYTPRVFTESGQPGTGIKALKNMGDLGNLFLEHTWLVKELGFINKYIELTAHRNTVHPNFQMPGTKTGRLSSSTPNMQQIPKSKVVMDMFRAKPGRVWVDLDFSALEPTVTTEFSQDPNMLFIYGDGAAPNDLYLFVAAQIPGLMEPILATGYDPYFPTTETLARAKKECKSQRSISKTVSLACAYGAGVNKVMQTLENDNIFLDVAEVTKIHRAYWDLFKEIKTLSRSLEQEWKLNGGYVINGSGRPICVTPDYKHDLLNRFIQSTGVDLLVKYTRIYTEELTRRGIPWNPLMINWHDSSAVDVPEEDADQVREVFLWAVGELNRQLQGTVKLRGEPDSGISLTDIKKPEA